MIEQHIKAWWNGGGTLTAHVMAYLQDRSPKWPAFERDFLAKYPTCAATGSREGVVAHHIVPYYEDPSKELDEDNLIPMAGPNGAHLCLAHFGNFKHWNIHIRRDAAAMLASIGLFIHEHGRTP